MLLALPGGVLADAFDRRLLLFSVQAYFFAVVPGFPAALVALVVAGLAWMAVTSTLQAELQLALPAWVRARGLAGYTVTFMGAQAAGALLWGLAASRAGLQPAVLLAAAVLLAGVIAGLVWRVPETGHLDPRPAVYWADARLAADPEPEAGPVLVVVHFTVAPARQAPFLEAMGRLRGSRLRTGATRWELYRDGERSDDQLHEGRTTRPMSGPHKGPDRARCAPW